VADKLIPMIAERARTLKIRNGMDAEAEMGPIVHAAARERIAGYIAQGVKEGARLLVDGREFQAGQAGDECADGFWLGATLFDEVSPEMRIYREEIFGPVLACLRVASLDEAIALINAHEFGNG